MTIAKYGAVFMLGWLVSVPVFLLWQIKDAPGVATRTCESVEAEQWAFVQCLKDQPACQMDKTVDAFSRFYMDKKWLAVNCPTESAGGSQSENK